MARVREIFTDKLRETQETIARLTQLVGDLSETLVLHGQLPVLRADAHARPSAAPAAFTATSGKAPLLVEGISKCERIGQRT